MEKSKEYKAFCSELLKAVKAQFLEEVGVEIHRVVKNNALELDGLVILKKGRTLSPDFYLQYYYEEFRNGVTIEELARKIKELYYESADSESSLNLDLSYEYCCDKIVFRLVSYERNIELLKTIPHIRFLDMAIIFFILIRSDEDGIGSVRVSKQLMEEWQLTKEKLYTLARENTIRIFPQKMCSMFSLMNKILELGNSKSREYMEEIAAEERCIPKEPYIITNSNGINGAAVLLYPNTLKEAGVFLGEDYYLLPSSIHEWLVIPVSIAIDVDDLYEMVWEVNTCCVSKEEVLSESVYFYDRELETITICKR